MTYIYIYLSSFASLSPFLRCELHTQFDIMFYPEMPAVSAAFSRYQALARSLSGLCSPSFVAVHLEPLALQKEVGSCYEDNAIVWWEVYVGFGGYVVLVASSLWEECLNNPMWIFFEFSARLQP